MESTLDIYASPCYYYGKRTFRSLGGVCIRNHLEEIRKKRNITQEELAAALEVSRQTIGSLENGRYNPSIILAIKIARYFNLSVEEIFIYEEEIE
jgi:putative transcriptional regulator